MILLKFIILVFAVNFCWAQKAYFSSGQYQNRQYPGQYSAIPIVSFLNDNHYDGSYKYSYETGNGISVQEQGYLKNLGQRDLAGQSAQGSFSYTSPEGIPISVRWYADETGFHAEGAHLPTPPPIPPAIAKSLAAQQHGQPTSYPSTYYPHKK